jgi:hypothetical protein
MQRKNYMGVYRWESEMMARLISRFPSTAPGAWARTAH